MVSFALFGCENKNKETLQTPTNLVVEDGIIIFDAVTSAEYYTISINDYEFTLDAKFSNNVELVDNQIRYDANKIFTLGSDYIIKVKATAEEKKDSSYTSQVSYNHALKIAKPVNLKLNGTNLTWDEVEGAEYYIVKVVTPYDTVLTDKEGNSLPAGDLSSIEKADLEEYIFHPNRFEFSSLLSKAGNYDFYVQAISDEDSVVSKSNFSSKLTYKHIKALQTPNCSISNHDGELHLVSVVDPNANAVTVISGDFKKTVELNGADASVVQTENVLDINLNRFFDGVKVEGESLDFSGTGKLTFKMQANYLASSDSKIYLDSNISESVDYTKVLNLTCPKIESLEFSNKDSAYILSWSHDDAANVAGFKVIISETDAMETVLLDKTNFSYMLNDDFISVKVQAVGVGSFANSQFCAECVNPKLTKSLSSLSVSLHENLIEWNAVADYYIVEINDQIIETTETSFDISSIDEKEFDFCVSGYKQGFKPAVKKQMFSKPEIKLDKPRFDSGDGFVGNNAYTLKFKPVENAIGYCIYMKASGTSEFLKIEKVFSSTVIDLSEYIINQGEYRYYEVKVQAVADKYGIYCNSELSDALIVEHVRKLSSPEFYKLEDEECPISKQKVGDSTKYILKFYGVRDADSYEILIDYNKKEINSLSYDYVDLYEVDITNYLSGARNYKIMVRAITDGGINNVISGDYSSFDYALTKQLGTVSNIKMAENNGQYTLTFNPEDYAEAYSVRVVKVNDENYSTYLKENNLQNPFVVKNSVNVAEYVRQRGTYYFYITALAAKESYYINSDESSEFAIVSKLETLNMPTNIQFENVSNLVYNITWQGDENANYYLVKVTDPNGFEFSVNAYSENININSYLVLPGVYDIEIASMVDPVINKDFISSAATIKELEYQFNQKADFMRHSICANNKTEDYVVDNVNELKNLLWYHFVYDIDDTYKLSVFLNLKENETVVDAINRLASEASEKGLYDFSSDPVWLELISVSSSEQDLFYHLCLRLLEVYPDMGVLKESSLSVSHESSGNQIFRINFDNYLDKIVYDTDYSKFGTTILADDYGNKYNYLNVFSRRNTNASFKIDNKSEMLVETTEQLLYSIKNGRKPKFYGNSENAQTVYSNAKKVLTSITIDEMSDLQKVTKIFDWIQYAFSLNHSATKYIKSSLVVDDGEIERYGNRQEFYLEAAFLNLCNSSVGNFDGEFYLGNQYATSDLYSKTFTLLCGIEGIQTEIVNGTYSYDRQGVTIKKDHNWNKVYLATANDGVKKWYALDIMFSDSKINHQIASNSYEVGSHTYFLTTDSFLQDKLGLEESSVTSSKECLTQFNYYLNSQFGLNDSRYSLQYDPGTTYKKVLAGEKTNYEQFLANILIEIERYYLANNKDKAVIEFVLPTSSNNNESTFNDSNALYTMISILRNSGAISYSSNKISSVYHDLIDGIIVCVAVS